MLTTLRRYLGATIILLGISLFTGPEIVTAYRRARN
jgi:hypothetical protein